MITLPPAGLIAIVDDNDVERMIIRRVLALSDLKNPVVGYESAPALLEELDRHPPDSDAGIALVLMDINMPDMTGFEALPRLRRDGQRADLLIAVMVASADATDDIDRALELGANLCIAKQSGIEKFVAEINGAFQSGPTAGEQQSSDPGDS